MDDLEPLDAVVLGQAVRDGPEVAHAEPSAKYDRRVRAADVSAVEVDLPQVDVLVFEVASTACATPLMGGGAERRTARNDPRAPARRRRE